MAALLLLVSVLISRLGACQQQHNWAQYVNPFIGGEGVIPGLAYGGGDIFVGASRPFSLAKVGIDTYEPNISFASINGGWTPQGIVTGISMMHVSGTGGAPKYGIISQMPLTSLEEDVNLLDNTTYWQKRVNGSESASVGFYGTTLENGVRLEVASGRRSGLLQYGFPRNLQEQHVLVDVSHLLPELQGRNTGQFYAGGSFSLEDGGRRYFGWGSYGGGFSNSAPATTYFCGEFDQTPAQARTFRGRNTMPVMRQHTLANEPIPYPTFRNRTKEESGPLTDRVGAIFSWSIESSNVIKSRIGISFMSAEQACSNKDEEIESWELQDLVDEAVEEWNRDVFSRIQVPVDESQNRTDLALLYSNMYFAHLMPSDRRGENPLSEAEDHWDDFYTAWDIFRCTTSLYHLIQPERYQSMIRALIDIWKIEGYLPDGRSGEYNGLVQGGSNADNILADAYVKNLPDINWKEAYQAMVKDAEVMPFNDFSYRAQDASNEHGRGALDDWLELGYVSVDHYSRMISRTIEYSLNDFSLSQVARGIAPDDVTKYLNRSSNWQNIWAHNLTHKSFTGFPAPRLSNGQFNLTDYNPAKCGDCSWKSLTYEATPFEYAFTVPQEMSTLIEFMGGPSEFERRLEYIFDPTSGEEDLGANGAGITTIMNIGNEPDFATPYEFHYINKQTKSVRYSRELGDQYFKNATYGIPGNSDAGAINSWMIWLMIGMYPVVTQPVYLIGSPWFSDINITVNVDKTLRVKAETLDNAERYFVKKVKINGQEWEKNWFKHDDLMVEGGVIEFEMGSEMVEWEKGVVPPSPGHVERERVK
ncbi:hypothetical protein CB0940_02327 [Cercospora beticola]|uniref:Glycosidase n=1 Tax=Cercospora beticola TaxID=122368 RepID=A0A2G5I2F6_CERBT|nr:hypothetical protein CB0940_02327 [Cercospora beticola]PIA98969.1 hypothetical protein CB0940_02327 [Cercospora beticola]WPA99454.1 hypothetical protein RHO25_004071 [Cercospora beticola]CAK1362421.1 unnamed protein product [Cercospora beticola]